MKTLSDLKKSRLADGKIDAAEVKEIKATIYTDGKIDAEEADFLFELNDRCSTAENDPSWSTLFINAICSYLLDDIQSPREIDKKESDWLLDKIGADGKIDRLELELLRKLASEAKSMPDTLRAFIEKNV